MYPTPTRPTRTEAELESRGSTMMKSSVVSGLTRRPLVLDDLRPLRSQAVEMELQRADGLGDRRQGTRCAPHGGILPREPALARAHRDAHRIERVEAEREPRQPERGDREQRR